MNNSDLMPDDLPVRARNLRLGARLREVRTACQLTLAEVEQLTDGRIKARTLAAYEHGIRAVSNERLRDLGAVYGFDIDGLTEPMRARGHDHDHDRVVLDADRVVVLPEDDPVRQTLERILGVRQPSESRFVSLRADDVSRLLIDVTDERLREFSVDPPPSERGINSSI